MMNNLNQTNQYDEIQKLFSKHLKINNINEQEIIIISNKLSQLQKSKLEVKDLSDTIDQNKKIIEILNEEISKLKKNSLKSEQEKQKVKQENIMLKKVMIEMKNKSNQEYELVKSSLSKLVLTFKNLKNESISMNNKGN